MAGRGGGGPLPLKEKGRLLPKKELLNQYEQHVKNCPSCSKVLASLTTIPAYFM
jgi:hypothetical protein